MQLDLSSDQQFFRETTSKFLESQAPVDVVRSLRDDPAGFRPEYWRRGADLGWNSLLVSEEQGGGIIGDSALVDLTLIAHEFGAHAAPGPLGPVNAVAAALSESGSHADLLAALMSGEAIASWCLTERSRFGSLADIDLQVAVTGDDVLLDGEKRPVESAGQAGYFLVTGRTAAGFTQVLVPADTAGVVVEPLKSVDLTRRFAAVRFDGVRLSRSHVVGEAGQAGPQVERQLQTAIVLHNAESVGAMQAAFDMTVTWAFDRYSFGRPLASYQALKHRFADMLSWLQASHAINDAAAEAVDSSSPKAAELVSAAKAYIGEFGSELIQDCVQLHGGIGVTFEHDLHLYLRRVTVNRALYGTPAEHRHHLGVITAGQEGMSGEL